MKSTFQATLTRKVNAMPRSIRFPYGEAAYGLTTYSSTPKFGRKTACAQPKSYAERLAQLIEADALTVKEC